MKFKSKNKFLQRTISILLVLTLIISNAVSLTAFAEGTEKYPYMLFGRNGITINGGNLCMNGNVHTNKEAIITASGKNINGKITTGSDIEKRIKHVYADTKIKETYFTENCSLYEDGYVRSEMNININNPVFSYGSIFLDGNVALNSNIGTLMNINITGEVKNANTAVVYSKYGDITIENDSTTNINGLIYAPLGTLTINSPNINLNGVIIADKIIINGSSININNRDSVAQFIGNTSEVYDFSGLEYLPESWLGDSDLDDLFDIYEKVIDTDPFDTDTDDDELPDGYEVLTLGTDPLEVDTDANGILDKDEDFDSDNLNNLGEYQNKTEPFIPDTDEDGLSDGDEVHTYGTEPLIPDTDNDKLLDGEEGYNGTIYQKYGIYFDALNPDTDNDGICDGDEVFGQSKQQDVITHDGAINQVTVDMDTNGNVDRNLSVESMYNVDAMSTNVYALVGEPFNFTTTSNFSSATIKFQIDQTKLGDANFNDLIILWYNEEKQVFEEMPTICDSTTSTVSTTTTHFSQYMVVDSVKWYQNWNNKLRELKNTMYVGGTSYYKNVNTVFLVDCSETMANVDDIDATGLQIGLNGVTKENYNYLSSQMANSRDAVLRDYGVKHCNRVDICENMIKSSATNDKASIIMFSDTATSQIEWKSKSNFLCLQQGLQHVNNVGGSSNLNNAINKALTLINNHVATSTDTIDTYRIVVLTHSGISAPNNLINNDWTNIDVDIVNLSSSNANSSVEEFAKSTGGNCYKTIYSSDLTQQIGSLVTTPPEYVGGKDYDEDTIPDIVEECGLMPNGQPIGTKYNLKDSDNDKLDDNVELKYCGDYLKYDMTRDEFKLLISCASDPTKPDTDFDGLNDKEERELKTDPNLSDTDKDGLDDKLDNAPTDPNTHSFMLYMSINENNQTDNNVHKVMELNDGSSSKLPEDLQYSDLSKSKLVNLKELTTGDFDNKDYNEHKDEMKSLLKKLSLGNTMDDVAISMFDHFIDGTGSDYSNTTLTNKVMEHENSVEYINNITNLINCLLSQYSENAYILKYNETNRNNSPVIQFMKNNNGEVDSKYFMPAFNKFDDNYNGLGILIHGLAGVNIDITSLKFDGIRFNYTLRFTFYDYFGLDYPDLQGKNTVGFESWYILQHYNQYKCRPFINYMVIEKEITYVP